MLQLKPNILPLVDKRAAMMRYGDEISHMRCLDFFVRKFSAKKKKSICGASFIVLVGFSRVISNVYSILLVFCFIEM